MSPNKALIIILILFNLIYAINCIKINDKFNKIKKKMGKLLNMKKGTELLLNTNDYEYPRANSTLRKAHREQWYEYYNCLKKLVVNIDEKETLKPSIITVFEGSSIR